MYKKILKDKHMCSITCASWNIMAPVPAPIRYTGQEERMKRIPNVLVEQLDSISHVDVVAVQESIVNSLHSILRTGMKRAGFIYETKQLVGSLINLKLVQGGLVIFSRYPIISQESLVFEGLCDREDCLSAKGVVYIKLYKENYFYHIFSLHLNSWESPKSRKVRRGQMAEVSKFVTKMNIPKSEPVIMMGDFNVDMYSQQKQIRALLDLIGFEMLPRHKDTHPFSSDPMTNQLMGIDDTSAYSSDAFPGGCSDEYMRKLQCVCCPQEWLDYAVYSKNHAPLDKLSSWMMVVPVKDKSFEINFTITMKREITDLSDHYPLLSRYVFMDVEPTTQVPFDQNDFLSHNEFTEQVEKNENMPTGFKLIPVLGFLVLGVVFIIVLIISCIYLRKRNNENNQV